MDNNNMSKESFKLCQKLYDEYGINYHDIEISVLNHLDFVQKGRTWHDVIGGRRVSFQTLGLGKNLMMWCDDGTEAIPCDIWQSVHVDIDLHLKNKIDLVRLVVSEIENNRYELTKVKGLKALVSNVCLWTAIRQVWGRKNADKWVELYDNAGHGYILDICAFKEAFKNK